MKFLGGFVVGILTTLVLELGMAVQCMFVGDFARASARDEIQRFGNSVEASFDRHEHPAGIVHLKVK